MQLGLSAHVRTRPLRTMARQPCVVDTQRELDVDRLGARALGMCVVKVRVVLTSFSVLWSGRLWYVRGRLVIVSFASSVCELLYDGRFYVPSDGPFRKGFFSEFILRSPGPLLRPDPQPPPLSSHTSHTVSRWSVERSAEAGSTFPRSALSALSARLISRHAPSALSKRE